MAGLPRGSIPADFRASVKSIPDAGFLSALFRQARKSLRVSLLGGVAALVAFYPGASFAATVGSAGAANTRSTGLPP
ncbi:MAG: hypothetical protein JO357_00820, partial [Hyphomicrobiales bacterium]|nr:hypothetical protein [Hyphomicrobiales bacterium]